MQPYYAVGILSDRPHLPYRHCCVSACKTEEQLHEEEHFKIGFLKGDFSLKTSGSACNLTSILVSEGQKDSKMYKLEHKLIKEVSISCVSPAGTNIQIST